MAKKKFNFEDAVEQLESLVEQMESGELSLEDSLSSFENGIKLIKDCQAALDSAEQKVNILLESQGEDLLETFEDFDDDDFEDDDEA